MEEQALTLSGLIDPREAVEIGRLTGARHLLLGELILNLNLATLVLRIVDAENGEIVVARGESTPVEDLFRLAAATLNGLLDDWGVPRTERERARLSRPGTVPLDGLINLGSALEAGEQGRLSAALTYLKAAVELSPDFTLAGDLIDEIEELAAGEQQRAQQLLRRYWNYIQPVSLGIGFYGSLEPLPPDQRDWFFEISIRPAWARLGMRAEPESMETVTEFLGRRIYTAHLLLERLLERELPREGFSDYLHPVEGMTGYFLTLFSALVSGPWPLPPIIAPDGRLVLNGDEYAPLLLSYCDMLLENFPYSSFSGIVVPVMQTLLTAESQP